jgi:hypothetical protein
MSLRRIIMDARFEKCRNGKHEWEVINEIRCHGNIDEITQWCPVCGCITIMQESDGRYVGITMGIKGPLTYKLYQRAERDLKEVKNSLHIKKIRADWRL